MEGIEDLGDDLEATEGRHEVGAGVAAPHLANERLRHLDARSQRTVARLAQPSANVVGNRDAGHLVVQKLRVAEAVQRQYADQYRDGRAPGEGQEPIEL